MTRMPSTYLFAAGLFAATSLIVVAYAIYEEHQWRQHTRARVDRLSAIDRVTAYVEQVEEEPGVDCEGNPFDERAWCEQWGIERWQVNF